MGRSLQCFFLGTKKGGGGTIVGVSVCTCMPVHVHVLCDICMLVWMGYAVHVCFINFNTRHCTRRNYVIMHKEELLNHAVFGFQL